MRLSSDFPEHLNVYADLLGKLGDGHRAGGNWVVRCPAHDDHTPSLGLCLGADGRLLIQCYAGCSTQAICSALGVKMGALFPPKEDEKRYYKAPITASYPYRDEKGEVLYVAERLEWTDTNGKKRKRFRQRRPDPAKPGKWLWHLGDVRRVLYRLPELLSSTGTVIVCEGERDCDTAYMHGFTATTNVCGARAEWLDDYSAILSGRHVVVIPDSDAPGLRHAYEVCGSLIVHDVASVRLAGLPAKDLSDYVLELRRKKVEDIHGAIVAALQEARQWRPARNHGVSRDVSLETR